MRGYRHLTSAAFATAIIIAGCNPFDVLSGGGPAEDTFPEAVAPDSSWIGVTMYEGTPDDSDGITNPPVIISTVLPGAPAYGALRSGDQIVAIDGKTIARGRDVSDIISALPPGSQTKVVVRRKVGEDGKKSPVPKTVTVTLTTERRVPISEWANTAYVGKPLTAPGTDALVASVGADGAITVGSQCTIEGDKRCPPFGGAKDMTFAAGRVTAVAFWPAFLYWRDAPKLVQPLSAWYGDYGPLGLRLVAATTAPARQIGEFISRAGSVPPMWLLHIDDEGLDGRLEALFAMQPAVAVVNSDGRVLAVCNMVDDDDMKTCEIAIGRSLGTVR